MIIPFLAYVVVDHLRGSLYHCSLKRYSAMMIIIFHGACTCGGIHQGEWTRHLNVNSPRIGWRYEGSMTLNELARGFDPVHSPSCVSEDSRSGEEFQIWLGCGCPRLQLASLRLHHVRGGVKKRSPWSAHHRVVSQRNQTSGAYFERVVHVYQ